jgi:hypothetical protein
MTSITLQLPPDLLAQVQVLAGTPENLQPFLIRAIEQEVQRQQPQSTSPQQKFWDTLQHLRAQMQAESIEINPDEIWGGSRDKTPGREIQL